MHVGNIWYKLMWTKYKLFSLGMYAHNQVHVVKVNLSVCLIKHSAVKVYVGEKAYIQAFFCCSLFYKADNIILG
jgi:hypothetical protein